MKAFTISAILGGLRGRSIQAVFLLGLCLLAFSYVAADFSPRQPQAVALDVGLSFLRFSLVLLAIFWVQELVGREFEKRTVLVAFSYPVPRAIYVLGRYFGVLVLLAMATLILGLFLWFVVMSSAHGYEQSQPLALGIPFLATLVGVYLDVAVVAAFTVCIATLSTVALLPLALGGLFAVATRAMGPVIDYLRQGADGDMHVAQRFGPLLDQIQMLIPDLSRLDWRAWPLYQLEPSVGAVLWPVLMAGAYIGILLIAAVYLCGRRELT